MKTTTETTSMTFARTITPDAEDSYIKTINYENDKWFITKQTGRSCFGNDYYVFSKVTKDSRGENEFYGQFTTLAEAKKYTELFKNL